LPGYPCQKRGRRKENLSRNQLTSYGPRLELYTKIQLFFLFFFTFFPFHLKIYSGLIYSQEKEKLQSFFLGFWTPNDKVSIRCSNKLILALRMALWGSFVNSAIASTVTLVICCWYGGYGKKYNEKPNLRKTNCWKTKCSVCICNPITRESLILPLSRSKAHLVHWVGILFKARLWFTFGGN